MKSKQLGFELLIRVQLKDQQGGTYIHACVFPINTYNISLQVNLLTNLFSKLIQKMSQCIINLRLIHVSQNYHAFHIDLKGKGTNQLSFGVEILPQGRQGNFDWLLQLKSFKYYPCGMLGSLTNYVIIKMCNIFVYFINQYTIDNNFILAYIKFLNIFVW